MKIRIFGLTITTKKVVTLLEAAALTQANKAIEALKQTPVLDHVKASIVALTNENLSGVEKLEKVALEMLPVLLSETGIEATKDFAIQFVQVVYNDLKGEVESLATKILKALGLK
jgi:hypothetical protein